MKSNGRSRFTSAAVAAVALLWIGWTPQDSGPPPAPPAPPTLEERVQFLETLCAEQHARIERLERVADALASGAATLAAAAEQARAKGFEAAGPNPEARTELLGGLTAFGAAMQSAVAKPDAESGESGGE